MTTFFTADDHFEHRRIIDLVPARKALFRDVDHMNTELVARWNSVVTDQDDVYVAGDFMLGLNLEANLPRILERLRGYKILLVGNHDRPSLAMSRSAEKRERWYRAYRDAGFDVVLGDLSDGSRAWTRRFAGLGRDVLLSHYPFEGESDPARPDRHAALRPVDDGVSYLVHGHVHDAWRTRGRQFNVGVDVNDFTPVAEETIVEWVNSHQLQHA